MLLNGDIGDEEVKDVLLMYFTQRKLLGWIDSRGLFSRQGK